MKKRLISMVLVAVMVLGVFAGCSKKETSGGSGVLTVGVPQNASITSYEDNALTKYIEEQTGIDLQFEFFSTGAGERVVKIDTPIPYNAAQIVYPSNNVITSSAEPVTWAG